MGALATQPATALEAFLRQEALRPSTTYLVQPLPDGSVQRLTWAEVGEQARRAAGYLASLQLPAGSCIGLLAPNCAHWIVADLAIWMAGHVSVPLHPGLTVDFISQVARHADLSAVFLGRLEGWPSQSAGLPDELVRLALPQGPEEAGVLPWSELQQHSPLEPHKPAADQPATIIYTSGTTGVPKGVVLSFASMCLAASNFLRLFTISASDRMLSCQSFSHIGERQFIEMTSLLGGQQVFFVERAASFLEDCRRARPTLFIASPRVWQDCMDACDRRWPARWQGALLRLPVLGPRQGRRVLAYLGLDQVRYAVSGAARLSPALQRRFAEFGLQVVEAYGMTENCGYSHLGRPSKTRPGFIGLPNPGVECRLGEQGELLVRSKTLMLGYHKDPARTAEVLDEDGFLHTGDAAEIDQEGFLRLTGRLRDTFKTSQGRYVIPAPIEQRLMDDALIEEACVVGQDLPQPLALVRLAAGLSADKITRDRLQTLFESVNETLPVYERLGCLVVVQSAWDIAGGFRTPTLKLRRNVVEATYHRHFQYWLVSGKSIVLEESDP